MFVDGNLLCRKLFLPIKYPARYIAQIGQNSVAERGLDKLPIPAQGVGAWSLIGVGADLDTCVFVYLCICVFV